MKLRMKGNSIRLRLTRPEVARLREGLAVEECCEFSDGARLRWALQPAGGTGATAAMEKGCITVSVPREALRKWAESDEVGIYAMSGPVDITIEKDFRCVSRAGDAKEADTFPNPAVR